MSEDDIGIRTDRLEWEARRSLVTPGGRLSVCVTDSGLTSIFDHGRGGDETPDLSDDEIRWLYRVLAEHPAQRRRFKPISKERLEQLTAGIPNYEGPDLEQLRAKAQEAHDKLMYGETATVTTEEILLRKCELLERMLEARSR